MSGEDERIGVEAVIVYFRVLFQNSCKNTMEDLSQDSWHPDQHSDEIPSGYKSEILPVESVCLVTLY
jgi:hypothetical protein